MVIPKCRNRHLLVRPFRTSGISPRHYQKKRRNKREGRLRLRRPLTFSIAYLMLDKCQSLPRKDIHVDLRQEACDIQSTFPPIQLFVCPPAVILPTPSSSRTSLSSSHTVSSQVLHERSTLNPGKLPCPQAQAGVSPHNAEVLRISSTPQLTHQPYVTQHHVSG